CKSQYLQGFLIYDTSLKNSLANWLHHGLSQNEHFSFAKKLNKDESCNCKKRSYIQINNELRWATYITTNY
ncbi:MAG: hypothetical protein WCF67_24035, partial [Chitinophagaceae bacterium]